MIEINIEFCKYYFKNSFEDFNFALYVFFLGTAVIIRGDAMHK